MTPQERWRKIHESEGLFSLKVKPGAGLCMVKGCRKEGLPRKVGLCHCHHQYRWRMNSPKKSAYATLRDHARGRGLEFSLSPDYFAGLCDAYAYFDSDAESRGECPSIDRIDPRKGYVPGNVRIVTVSQNSVKAARERHLPGYVQAILDRKRARAKGNPALADEQERGEDECPF